MHANALVTPTIKRNRDTMIHQLRNLLRIVWADFNFGWGRFRNLVSLSYCGRLPAVMNVYQGPQAG